VVALLFIIFDVEVAFFFPWAVVYGKATHLMDPNAALVESSQVPEKPIARLTPAARNTLANLGVPRPELPDADADALTNSNQLRDAAGKLAATSIVDILVFFAVLMVGFAYVWRRGDLDWVRAVSRERSGLPGPSPPLVEEPEHALVG
jgi:NADH-quinone oxidoreductase subunit A